VREVIEPRVRTFKQRFFGRNDVILHTVDMGNNAGDFSFLTDPGLRAEFYIELNTMLGALDYKVIAAVIKKHEYIEHYGASAADPYVYALEMLIDRFCWELGEDLDSGFICAD